MPLWLGAVVARDARPVEDEGHAGPVQCDVHEDLVEGPVEEGRVDGDDRVQAGEGQAGGARHGVLLGDADVERPGRGGAAANRCSPTGMSIAAVMPTTSGRSSAIVGDLVARRATVQAGRRVGQRAAGLGVEDADAVEAVGLVVLGRRPAAALCG